jgi:hypothetical protein
MRLQKKIMMNDELFQDLAKIKIPYPTKNKDQKPVEKKLKALIVFLYAISIILLYIGITMSIDTQISLSAILFNAKKFIFLLSAALLNFIVSKISTSIIMSSISYPPTEEDINKAISKFLTTVITTFVLVGILAYLVFTTNNPITDICYICEFVVIISIAVNGLNIFDLLRL